MAPRMYYAMDANLTSTATIEELGETHGAEGPMVIVALLGLAKQQGGHGEVRTTIRKLTAGAFLSDPAHAGTIVEHAARLGVLEALDLGDREIHVRFPRWSDWQLRQKAAERQADHREREKEEEPA